MEDEHNGKRQEVEFYRIADDDPAGGGDRYVRIAVAEPDQGLDEHNQCVSHACHDDEMIHRSPRSLFDTLYEGANVEKDIVCQKHIQQQNRELQEKLEGWFGIEYIGNTENIIHDAGRVPRDNQDNQRLELHVIVSSPMALYFEHDEQNHLKYKG